MIDKTVCGSCGSDLAPPGSRFCPACGRQLSGAADVAASSDESIPMAQAEPIVDVSTVTYDEVNPNLYNDERASGNQEEEEEYHYPSSRAGAAQSTTPAASPSPEPDRATYYVNPTPAMLQRSNHRTVGGVLIIAASTPRGKFTLPKRMHAGQILGGVTIDCSYANFVHPVTTIHAGAVLGQVKLTVPRGVRVEAHGLGILGEFASPVESNDAAQVAPLIIIQGVAILAAVIVKVNSRCPAIKVIS